MCFKHDNNVHVSLVMTIGHWMTIKNIHKFLKTDMGKFFAVEMCLVMCKGVAQNASFRTDKDVFDLKLVL